MFLFIPFIFLFVEARHEPLLEYFMVEGSVRLAASFRFFSHNPSRKILPPVYLSKGKITFIDSSEFFIIIKGRGGGEVAINRINFPSNPLNFFPPLPKNSSFRELWNFRPKSSSFPPFFGWITKLGKVELEKFQFRLLWLMSDIVRAQKFY